MNFISQLTKVFERSPFRIIMYVLCMLCKIFSNFINTVIRNNLKSNIEVTRYSVMRDCGY